MNFGKCTYISWEKYEESPEIQVQNEDVLLVKTGSSYGKCAYVESLPKEATINPQFVVLKFIGCNPRFLTFCLQSNYARKQYEEFVLGTAIPTFTQVALGAMAIPMPPIEEQERIVTEVEKLLTIVDNIEQSKQDLSTAISQTKNRILDLAIHGKLVPQDANDESASELLKRINPKAEITCDNGQYGKMPFEIPNSWLWLSHNDILEISGGSQPAKSYFKETPENGYIRLYQIRDYGEHPVPVYIPIELASKTTQKGDILLARYGGSLGKVFIAEDGAYNVAMAKVILKFEHLLDKEFVYFYYLSKLYQDKLQTISRTAQAGFNSSDFEDMYFPLPPIEEQQRIVHRIKSLYLAIDNIQKALEV